MIKKVKLSKSLLKKMLHPVSFQLFMTFYFKDFFLFNFVAGIFKWKQFDAELLSVNLKTMIKR